MVMMLPPRPGCCSFCATICLAAALEHATAHNTCCGKPQWLHGTLKVAMVNQTEGEQQCQEQHAESINQLVPAAQYTAAVRAVRLSVSHLAAQEHSLQVDCYDSIKVIFCHLQERGCPYNACTTKHTAMTASSVN
jgi:hypothetical protein